MFDPDALKRIEAAREDWRERELREFLDKQPETRADCRTASGIPTERVYTPLNEDANTERAQHIVRALFAHFAADPERLPAEYRPRPAEDASRRVADFVASMTDHYAIELYEQLYVPQHWSV